MGDFMPTPNFIRFGFGTGHIAVSNDGLIVGGQQDRDGDSFLEVTDENRQEVTAVLRLIADHLEGQGVNEPEPKQTISLYHVPEGGTCVDDQGREWTRG